MEDVPAISGDSPSAKSDFLPLEETSPLPITKPLTQLSPENSEKRDLIPQPDELRDKKIPKPPGGVKCLCILFCITLLSYIDRYLPSAMKEDMKHDLQLSDAETSYPFTAFLIVYMCVSPIYAHLSDMGLDRRKLILSGVVCWSVATASNYFVQNFWEYMVCRAFVAIGESALVTIAPTLICDFYPPEERNRIFARYAMATPVGAGFGYILGGVLSGYIGWRATFLVCGIPGVIAAVSLLTITEPPRGHFETPQVHAISPSYKATLHFLIRNPRYLSMNAGYTLGVFAVGGLSDWVPSFLERQYGTDATWAGLVVGGITIFTTPIGVLGGSFLADRFKVVIRESNFAISAVGATFASILAFPSFLAPNLVQCAILLAFCETFLWFNSAPWSTETSSSVPPLMRARAFGVSMFFSHALGDAISPSIIGLISDQSGLRNAILLIPGMMAISAIVWGVASCLLKGQNFTTVELTVLDQPPELERQSM